MPGALAFNLLGPLEVRRADGSLLDLGGPQPRLVLGQLLIAEGRLVSAEALIDILWGDQPPPTAAGTLQTYVSRLRKAFDAEGPRSLRYRSGGYQLDVEAGQVDSRRFEQLARQGGHLLAAGDHDGAVAVLRDALSLWRGPLLADAAADFAQAAGARLQERRLTATEDLFDAELHGGAASSVVADLTDAVAASPLRERMRGLLATALYRTGRQADALAVIDAGRRLLAEELGLDLGPALRGLQDRILAQDDSLEAVVAPPVEASPRPAASPPDGPVTPPMASPELIGRDAEERTLHALLDEIRGDRTGRYAIIEGEPGIGKTSLARAVLARAQSDGWIVRSTATLEDGASPAFGPWLDLVRAARQRDDPVPELFSRLLEGTGPFLPGASPAAVGAALAESVAVFSATMASDRGLVILLEDLQWADPASLDLLCALGPRLAEAPVLIMTTVRELERGRDGAVVDALARMTRHLGTRRVTLRGLSESESGQLLSRAAGVRMATGVVAAVHARAQGNPFFTTEIARMMGEQEDFGEAAARSTSVPTGVRDVLQRRVARLPAATVQVLEVAAVLGREAELTLLAEVAGRSLDDCLDDLEPALLSRLLEVPADVPGAVRFTHALVREALADGLSPLRKARLHLRAADGILASVGQTDDTAEIVAEHLWQAAAVGVSARAAVALEAAAQVALKRQALGSAEHLLDRAASLYRAAGTEDGLAELRVLRQLGFVGAALHGYPVNADSPLIARARELARSTDRLDILLDMIWADWAGCDTAGQPLRGDRLVVEAESLVDGVDDPLLQGGVASMRGFTDRHFGRMGHAYESIERALRLFTEAGESRDAGFYLTGFLTSRGYRYWAGAMTLGLDREGLEREYLDQELPFGRMVIAFFGAAATLSLGDEAGVRLFAERMVAADPEMVLSFWSSSAELYSAVSLLQRGDIDSGLAVFEQGWSHMRQASGRTMLAGLSAAAAQALALAGLVDRAREMLVRSRTELLETHELAYVPIVEIAEAHLCAAEGDRPAMVRHLELAAAAATEQESFGLLKRVHDEAERLRGGQPAV